MMKLPLDQCDIDRTPGLEQDVEDLLEALDREAATLRGLRALRAARYDLEDEFDSIEYEAQEDGSLSAPAKYAVVAELADGSIHDDEAHVGPHVANRLEWTRVEAKQWIKVLEEGRPEGHEEGQVQYRIVLADDPTMRFVD